MALPAVRHTTRRELVALLLGAPVAAASCRPSHPPLPGGVLLDTWRARGHAALRDAAVVSAGSPDARTAEVVVVGAGVAGLSAAWWLERHGLEDVLVLELGDVIGGTARGEDHPVTPCPWGAHYIVAPQEDQPELVTLLDEMGLIEGKDEQGLPVVAEEVRCREPEERLFYLGRFYPGLYLRAGATAADLDELARFQREVERWVLFRDAAGRRAFALPRARSSSDAEVTALDGLSFASFLDQHGFRSARLRWLCDYACRDDYGLDAAGTSAWAGLFYFAARQSRPQAAPQPVVTWPDGNGALVRHLARRLRVETGAVVTRVVEDGAGVRVEGRGARGPFAIHAKAAVVAVPEPVAARIAPRPGAETGAPRPNIGAWTVANLHLTSRPAERPGASPAWDNVSYHSKSLGYVCATHQRGRDHGPTIWTWYYPFTDLDGARVRRALESATREDWAETALADLERMHPDVRKHVTRIDVAFWGHAMVRPTVGSIWHPGQAQRALAHGAIHYAHTDLSGIALFEEALDHGVRAAREVLVALRGAAP